MRLYISIAYLYIPLVQKLTFLRLSPISYTSNFRNISQLYIQLIISLESIELLLDSPNSFLYPYLSRYQAIYSNILNYSLLYYYSSISIGLQYLLVNIYSFSRVLISPYPIAYKAYTTYYYFLLLPRSTLLFIFYILLQ